MSAGINWRGVQARETVSPGGKRHSGAGDTVKRWTATVEVAAKNAASKSGFPSASATASAISDGSAGREPMETTVPDPAMSLMNRYTAPTVHHDAFRIAHAQKCRRSA